MAMSQPDAFQDDDVPQFSASLEAHIRVALVMRLGREPTREELGITGRRSGPLHAQPEGSWKRRQSAPATLRKPDATCAATLRQQRAGQMVYAQLSEKLLTRSS